MLWLCPCTQKNAGFGNYQGYFYIESNVRLRECVEFIINPQLLDVLFSYAAKTESCRRYRVAIECKYFPAGNARFC